MKVLCTILARGGSKSVPGKNLRPLAGRPLLVHTVEQARAAGVFDCVAASSDDPEILRVAQEAGVDMVVTRPAALAGDTAPKIPAVIHCLEEAEAQSGERFDIVVDLDPTSPLRLPEDVRTALARLQEAGAGNLVTAAPARKSPYFNLLEVGDDGVPRLAKEPSGRIHRRQDAPACYDMNASIYVWTREALVDREGLFHDDTVLYVMPEERSWDIDSELDFAFVDFLMRSRSAAS